MATAPEPAFALHRPVPLEGVHAVTDWAWAQARTNFVIVGPQDGARWRIEGATVRGESAHHFSTVRYRVTDGRRRLRVKQYWHDWWIPTIPDISFRRLGVPVVWGPGHVSFVGRDYRRQDASCGHVWGTGVECGVEEGALDVEDWIDLWAGFGALEAAAVDAARGSSYADRSYWNRWGRTTAPWDSTEISSLRWRTPDEEVWQDASWACSAEAAAALAGAVDAIGRRDGPEGPERQLVWRDPQTLTTTAWMRVLQRAPAAWRPLMDASEVNRPVWEAAEVGGRAIERASMHPEVGNWFFAWRDGARAFELHLRAEDGLDRAAAERRLRAFLAA